MGKRYYAHSNASDHTQGTDQYLDLGGANQCAVADVKDAVGKKHNSGSDTALGSMSADIDMNSHKLTGLSVPSSAGDSIRATSKITEAAMEDAVDKKHTPCQDAKQSVVKASTATLTATEMQNMQFNNSGQTAEDAITFAATVAGLGGSCDVATGGYARHFVPNSADSIIFDGVDLTAGCKFTAPSQAVGDKFLIDYLKANTWNVTPLKGTFTTPLPLQATFTAGNQSFSNGDLLNTLAKGVQQGSGTVTQTNNTHAIASNKMRGTYVSDADASAGIVFSNAIPHNSGNGLFFTLDIAGGTYGPVIGMFDAASLSGNPIASVYRYGASIMIRNYPYSHGKNIIVTTVGAAEEVKLGVVFGATYNFYFLLRDGETDWEMIGALPNGSSASGYFVIVDYQSTYDVSNVVRTRNAVDIQTPVYSTDTPDELAHDVGSGDICALFTFTMPASGTDVLEFRYRYQDSNNYWKIKITAGTAGTDFSMHKVSGGVEGGSVATKDVDWVAGAQYSVQILTNGDSEQRVNIFRPGVPGSAVQCLSYTSTDADFATETEIQIDDITGSVFTLNSIRVWKRKLSTYNTEITSVTDSIY